MIFSDDGIFVEQLYLHKSPWMFEWMHMQYRQKQFID